MYDILIIIKYIIYIYIFYNTFFLLDFWKIQIIAEISF